MTIVQHVVQTASGNMMMKTSHYVTKISIACSLVLFVLSLKEKAPIQSLTFTKNSEVFHDPDVSEILKNERVNLASKS